MDDGFDVQTIDGQPVINGMFVRSVEAMDGTFKDVDEGRREVLVEFPHERVDTYKTTFGADAFRDSFANRLPVMCWQHDLREPIGRAISAQVMPRANELVGKMDDFDAVPLARRAFTQIQSKTLTDFSFGFRDPLYEPHPQHRGVRRIKRATMKEFSPVTVGSIPGAIATGTREEDLMEEHSAEEIRGLVEAKLITEEEGKRMLAQIPFYREHLTVSSTTATEAQRVEEIVEAVLKRQGAAPVIEDEQPERINAATIVAHLPEEWQRQMAEADAKVYLVLGDEEWGPIGESRAIDDTAAELIAQVDAACRSASDWLSGVDATKFPDELRQAIGLYRAAGNAADALMETLVRADGDGEDDGMVTCPTCKGTGKIREGHVTCPTCHGKGEVTKEVADDNRAQTRAYWQDPANLRFVSVDERKKMADTGVAMPNGDFPIPDKGHLQSALGHFSSYTGDKKEAAAHIKKRAKALGVKLSDDALESRAPAKAYDDDDDSIQDKVHESGTGTPEGEEEEVEPGETDTESEEDDEDEDKMAGRALKRLERHAARA